MTKLQEHALKCGAWNQVYGQRNFMIDEHFDIEKFTKLIVHECIWAFGQTRTEPCLAKYVYDRLGIEVKIE